MAESERAVEIEWLLKELSERKARKAALLDEAQAFAARIHEIRAAFGNPFFYSHPEDPDESAAHYTRSSSIEVAGQTFLALAYVERELREIKDQLRGLGVSAD